MGRLSKKAIEEKKKEKVKYIISLGLESIAGSIIFSLLLFILISVGQNSLMEIIEFIQEKHLELPVTFIALPVSFIIIFTTNIARSFMIGELEK